ncbi:MAG TPA: hypothetical protein VHO27_01140 [Angustibacter sp.]|nr:hypothetical protein [Angustibacter sp.]
MSGVTVQATWFGPSNLRLLGWLHAPDDGTARGGVVLCPTIGQEHVASLRGVSALADRLAASGLAVLRYDHAGTGDSAGCVDPEGDLVPEWLNGVAYAERFLLDIGLRSVDIVGLRVGGLVAAAAAARCRSARRLVLWDPFGSGREYLREQQARAGLSLATARAEEASTASPLERVDGVGVDFSAATAASLAALSVGAVREFVAPAPGASPDRSGRSVLLLTREERFARSLRSIVDVPGVRQRAVRGQGALLAANSYESVVDTATLDVIVQALATDDPPCLLRWVPTPQAVVDDTAGVVERVVRLGTQQLFGVLTWAPGFTGSTASCAVFVSPATDHHVGPGRAWVDLARRMAPHGVLSLRFDRLGVAESAVPQQRAIPLSYTEQSVRDAEDVVSALRDLARSAPDLARWGDAAVDLIGLCSGAWVASVAAPRVRARRLVAINPVIWLRRPRPLGPASIGEKDQQLVESSTASSRSVSRTRLKGLMPHRAWRLVARAGAVNAVDTLVRPALRRGAEVHILLGHVEQALFAAHRGPESLRRLRSHPLRVYAVPGADHSLQSRRGRSTVCDVVVSTVTSAGTTT